MSTLSFVCGSGSLLRCKLSPRVTLPVPGTWPALSPRRDRRHRTTLVACTASPEASNAGTGHKGVTDQDTVTIKFRGEEIVVRKGIRLRTALLRQQAKNAGDVKRNEALLPSMSPHNGGANIINCRGLGTCGTCAVSIESGNVAPLDRSLREKLRLNFPPHTLENAELRNLRLACQVRVVENLSIAKFDGFWGHGDNEQPY